MGGQWGEQKIVIQLPNWKCCNERFNGQAVENGQKYLEGGIMLKATLGFVFISVLNGKTQCILRKFMDNIKLEECEWYQTTRFPIEKDLVSQGKCI